MLELPSEPTFRSNVYNCIYRKRAYLDSFIPPATRVLTSSAKVTEVVGSAGAAVHRKAGCWPRVRQPRVAWVASIQQARPTNQRQDEVRD